MEGIFNLILPLFWVPKNYAQMLQRLAGAIFYETYAITFFLRDIPLVGAQFRAAESYGALGAAIETIPHSSALNIAGFMIAVAVALLSHIAQLHDRISDICGIRRRFDRKRILLPLAELVGADKSKLRPQTINARRDSLMRDVFYRYASSRAETPVVDKHDIEHALAAWSWFWIFIEAVVLFGVACAIAFLLHANTLGQVFVIVAACSLLVATLQHRRLWRYARAEIEQIASNGDAAKHVRDAFNAL